MNGKWVFLTQLTCPTPAPTGYKKMKKVKIVHKELIRKWKRS